MFTSDTLHWVMPGRCPVNSFRLPSAATSLWEGGASYMLPFRSKTSFEPHPCLSGFLFEEND